MQGLHCAVAKHVLTIALAVGQARTLCCSPPYGIGDFPKELFQNLHGDDLLESLIPSKESSLIFS